MQALNQKNILIDQQESQNEMCSSILALEHSWIIFMLLLVSSFYWWGRIDIGVLRAPLVALYVPVIGIFWAYSLPFKRGAFYKDNIVIKIMIPLMVMIWGMVFSLLNTNNISNAIAVLFEIMFYIFLYYLMLKTIRTVRAFNKITMALIFGISYLALEGLVRFFITKTIWRVGAGDVHTATNMGAFMFQAVIILITSKLIFDKEESKTSKFLFMIMLSLISVAFIFSYSRGAWITLIIGVIVLTMYRKFLIIPIVIISLLVIPLLPRAFFNRVVSIIDSKSSSTVELYRDAEVGNTTHLRLKNWETSFNDVVDNPIFGLGIGYYHGSEKEKGEIAPHNAYLRIWAECGPIAIIGFLWFIITLTRSLSAAVQYTNDKWKWLSLGFFAVFVTHIFYMLLGDWPYQVYFWVFASLATTSLKVLHPDYINE